MKLELKNAEILCSIREISNRGIETQHTFFARVSDANENTVTVIRLDDKSSVSIPYDEDVFEVAEPGFYELNDGSTLENPKYIVQWVKYESESAWKAFSQNSQSDE